MANTARKAKADSAQKVVKSRKAAQPDVLRLEADQRIDVVDPWSLITPMAAEDIAAVVAAFDRNRLKDGLDVEPQQSNQTSTPFDERAEAARKRMQDLLSATPVVTDEPDLRVTRTSIKWPQREFDAVLENRVREIVRETLNEMLAGDTGAKLSAGIRRMVRREVEQLLALDRTA